MLHEFLTENTQEIIARTRVKVATGPTPALTEEELKNGVPLFLSQLIARLRLATLDSGAIEQSATKYGGELLAMGFTVSQVVHGYGDLCQAITKLADEKQASITADEFHTFNRCLDDAIAHAVTEYQRRRDESVAYEETEHLGRLAHEMRNRISAAMLALSILQEGTVGIGGSTAAVLDRSLRGLRDLVNNSLARVRLESGLGKRVRISMAELIGEVEVEAVLEANAGGFELAVSRVEPGIEVDADPQILSAAIANLLQNAFKFSRKGGHVRLRTRASPDRVLIDVEDQGGGLLSPEQIAQFLEGQQGGRDKSGLGFGLTISKRAIEAMGGTVRARNELDTGCVFTIDLPRGQPIREAEERSPQDAKLG